MMATVTQRWSWAGSLGVHALLLLFLFVWGTFAPPRVLPKPEPIRLTIIDFPGKTGPAAAPGPAKQPQMAKGPARPAPLPVPARPAKAAERVPVVAKTQRQQVTEPARTVTTRTSTAQPNGSFQAALAQRKAQLAARSAQRLSEIGDGSGTQLITGTGGGDAGAAGGELAGRQLLREVRPHYPRSALAERVSGRVQLTIVVSASGHVSRVSIRSSSGDSRLDAAAREAIAQWRFAPIPEGLPETDAQGTVPVTFWYRKG